MPDGAHPGDRNLKNTSALKVIFCRKNKLRRGETDPAGILYSDRTR